MTANKMAAFENSRDEWADQLIQKHSSKLALRVVEIIKKRMETGRMTLPFRLLHVIFGFFYRLEMQHNQNIAMYRKGEKGFQKDTMVIKSVTVKLFINKKLLGEKEFPLGLVMKQQNG
jgi:hypothetical protein